MLTLDQPCLVSKTRHIAESYTTTSRKKNRLIRRRRGPSDSVRESQLFTRYSKHIYQLHVLRSLDRNSWIWNFKRSKHFLFLKKKKKKKKKKKQSDNARNKT